MRMLKDCPVSRGSTIYFSAHWGGYRIPPTTGYVYENDEFSGECAVLIVNSSGLQTKVFGDRSAAIAHVVQLIKLQTTIEEPQDEFEHFVNRDADRDTPIAQMEFY